MATHCESSAPSHSRCQSIVAWRYPPPLTRIVPLASPIVHGGPHPGTGTSPAGRRDPGATRPTGRSRCRRGRRRRGCGRGSPGLRPLGSACTTRCCAPAGARDAAVGGAEEPHRRGPDRGGEVEERGVRGDEQVAAGDHRRGGGEVELAAQVDRVGGEVEAHRLRRLAVAGVADQDDAGAVAGGQPVGKVREPLGAPGRARRRRRSHGRERWPPAAGRRPTPLLSSSCSAVRAASARGTNSGLAGSAPAAQRAGQAQPGLGAVAGRRRTGARRSAGGRSIPPAQPMRRGMPARYTAARTDAQLAAHHGHVEPAAAQLAPQARQAERASGASRAPRRAGTGPRR